MILKRIYEWISTGFDILVEIIVAVPFTMFALGFLVGWAAFG